MGLFTTLCRNGMAVCVFAASVATAYAGINETIRARQASVHTATNVMTVINPSNHTIAFEPVGPSTPSMVVPSDIPAVLKPSGMDGLKGVLVGTTYYDFQTNGSMPNRIVFGEVSPNERYIQMLWMAATDSTRDAATRTPGFNNSRGSYCTIIDGNDVANPLLLSDEWFKIELLRAGWPSLVRYSDNTIGTPSHTPVTYYKNTAPTDPLFENYTVATEADNAFWARAAVDANDNTHLIYNKASSADPAQATNQVAYRRMARGSSSFEPEVLLTGPTIQGGGLPNGSGGDSYAISANGQTVAIIYRDAALRLIIRVSRNGGETWPEARVVYDPPFVVDSTQDAQGWSFQSDTVVTPNSSMDVLVDNAGTIHFVFTEALGFLTGNRPNGGTRTNFINELAPADLGLNGQLGIAYGRFGDSVITRAALAAGTGWDGRGLYLNRRFGWGFANQPQLGCDKDNNLYMVYTSPKNGDIKRMLADTTGRLASNPNEPDTLTEVDALNMHVYATYRPANSNSWAEPKDITPTGMNCQWATLCDTVPDGVMLIGYAAKPSPGDQVTNLEQPVETTSIYLYAMRTSELNPVNSVDSELASRAESGVRVAPNPVSDVATVTVDAVTHGTIRVSLVSSLGEILATTTHQATADASITASLPVASVATGAYYVMVEQAGTRVTRPLSIVR
ncbi:MAG: T9SS type A sorting domain-containing protein [Candidatus Kapabacteria bacterium]|jgi:hypothetical protein|nr:T9SS type A sorting domain-containing protein [Candidatus Kapabacteria bacterium]